MVKRNAIATKLTKRCTQTQKRAFDVAVHPFQKRKKIDLDKSYQMGTNIRHYGYNSKCRPFQKKLLMNWLRALSCQAISVLATRLK